ncbi:MAG: Fis family transcriptional regulator [Desulfuromonas sp.]|nr:MAG: Fis family transcriptional regulator [Desulfuromonas sp.]
MLDFHKLDVDALAFLRKIFDAAGRGLLLVDCAGRAVLVNRLARKWLNLADNTLLTTTLPALWNMANPVVSAKQASNEAPLVINNREILVQINPILQGEKRTGAVCVLVESRLVESMSRRLPSLTSLSRELDAIIDSSSDGLFVCDGAANVIRMNPASERIHQVSSGDIVGRNMSELIDAGFIDRSAALETSRTGDVVTLMQNKAGRKLMSIATPVCNDVGELERIVVSERDITEIDRLQREIEEQEAKANIFRDQILEQQQAALEARRVIARSPSMVKALEQAIKVSAADSSVLILGESGVGKGLIADLIHQHSTRSDSPLIKINCGAIPESLIEAELFGYEKGAFTGARDKGKPGHFELADGGILFLDEIAELPLASQVKLLRFLEDGQVVRLGGTSSRRVDVRILAATHRDLKEMVAAGRFRLDLYYRLNVIPLSVPPLRQRGECLVPLLRHYIEQFSVASGQPKRLTRAALDVLTHYDYPGNVRELMNLCERLVVMTETEMIGLTDLPAELVAGGLEQTIQQLQWQGDKTLQEVLDDVEKQLLSEARERFCNQTDMAAALGVNQSTIARKLKKHNLN